MTPASALRLCVSAVLVFSAFSASSAAADRAPRRIISLVPAVTEMLFAIGAGSQVVAVSSFDEWPPEVSSLPRVGALLDPDVERILSLKPDLVVVYGTQSDLRRQLERAGIPQFFYKHGDLAGVTRTIRALGGRTDRAPEAERLAGRIEARLKTIRTTVAGRPRPTTLLVFGRESLALRGIFASGGIGFLHDMLDVAGGANVFSDVRRESVQATTEMILARRPQVVVELRSTLRPDQIEPERAVWGALAAVPAVRTKRIHILADPSLVVPGPRIADAAELIARTLHPEAFRIPLKDEGQPSTFTLRP